MKKMKKNKSEKTKENQPVRLVGLGRVELPTSRLSDVGKWRYSAIVPTFFAPISALFRQKSEFFLTKITGKI